MPAAEIQAAHDRLVAILNGEVPNLFSTVTSVQAVRAAADVLCWVLKHDYNTHFGEVLEQIDAFMKARGLQLRDSGKLQVPPGT